MADDNGEVAWFAPRTRALFPLEGIRVSRSLARTIRSGVFDVRFDTAFEAVVRACRRPEGNWISEEIIQVFTEIHREGWGHCAECWLSGELVGGVYGISIGRCFCAESMFHRRRDASKVALLRMIDWRRSCGDEMFDAQIMSPHLASLGAFEVTQAEYLDRLRPMLG